jgi:hypothetical protein
MLFRGLIQTYINDHQKHSCQYNCFVHPTRAQFSPNSGKCQPFVMERLVGHSWLKILTRRFETQAESHGGFEQLNILESGGERVSDERVVFGLIF